MATIRKIYAGDVGTDIIINMGANIVSASNVKFVVTKPKAIAPDETEEVVWIAVIEGTDSFKYTINTGDLDVDGYYEIRPQFTLGTWAGSGNKVGFAVEPK